MLYPGGALYMRRKRYHRFFFRAPKILKISDIFILLGIWANTDKLKWIFKINNINKINQEIGSIILTTLKLLQKGVPQKE